MKKFTYTIKNEIGIHVLPASQLAKAAGKYLSKIFITKGEKTVEASNILAVMSLEIKYQDKISVSAMGGDETVAIEGIKKFIKENF